MKARRNNEVLLEVGTIQRVVIASTQKPIKTRNLGCERDYRSSGVVVKRHIGKHSTTQFLELMVIFYIVHMGQELQQNLSACLHSHPT